MRKQTKMNSLLSGAIFTHAHIDIALTAQPLTAPHKPHRHRALAAARPPSVVTRSPALAGPTAQLRLYLYPLSTCQAATRLARSACCGPTPQIRDPITHTRHTSPWPPDEVRAAY